MNCPFCTNQDIKERIILENDLAKAFLTNIPIVPGHTLIVSKRCVSKFDDLTLEEKNAVFDLMKKLKVSLEKSFGAQGFNHAWNENQVAGQSILHFHLHLIPRKKWDSGIHKYEPREFIYRPGSRTESENEELLQITELIKDNL